MAETARASRPGEHRYGRMVKTAWGSRAEVLLANDQSQMIVQPHTRLQINSRRRRARHPIGEGQVNFHVSKQPRNNTVTISTPEAQITVVGTALDVQVITKSDGRKQTWVDVRSGRVELASGGQHVVLLPEHAGHCQPGEPPIARSQTAEVNELARLAERTAALGGQGGGSARSRGDRRVRQRWLGDGLVVDRDSDAAGANLKEGCLECNVPEGGLEVFSLQGPVPVVRRGQTVAGRLVGRSRCRRVGGGHWLSELATWPGCSPPPARVCSSFPRPAARARGALASATAFARPRPG